MYQSTAFLAEDGDVVAQPASDTLPDTYQETSFASFEGCEICQIAHDLPPVNEVEAVAHSSALLQAVGPMHRMLLQGSKCPGFCRHKSMQLWLQPHTQVGMCDKLVQTYNADNNLWLLLPADRERMLDLQEDLHSSWGHVQHAHGVLL